MTDYHNQMTGEYGDPNFVEGPSHDEATELMLAHKEIERLRAALQFISDYEGSLNADSAYLEMKRRASDAVRLIQQKKPE